MKVHGGVAGTIDGRCHGVLALSIAAVCVAGLAIAAETDHSGDLSRSQAAASAASAASQAATARTSPREELLLPGLRRLTAPTSQT